MNAARTLPLPSALLALALASGGARAGGIVGDPGLPDISVPFEACGTLIEAPESGCVNFVTHNGGEYTIEFTGDFGPGDAVCVAGELVSHNCATTCGPVDGCIFNNTITDQFNGFGTILIDLDCPRLITPDGGAYQVNGLLNGVDHGDLAHVTGTLDAGCFSLCLLTCIQDAVVTPALTATGTIGIGPQGCPLFAADDGSGSWILQNTGGFLPGDRVLVTGAVLPQSNLCLPLTLPGLGDNTIDGYFEGAGGFGPGPQGCLLFNADSGASFAIPSTGGFGIDDRVWVSGIVNPESFMCFPAIVPGIEDPTILGLFEGCGTVAIGPQACLAIQTEAGDFYSLSGDSMGADSGDLVAITGPLIPESFNCFPVLTTELAIEAITPCIAGDVTRDGVVDVSDLVAVILAWNSEDHWADVDGSGTVDVADLVAVILGWSA